MSALPSSMKALRMHAAGQPLVLETIPVPQPGPNQVLIEVHAASLNPVDWKLRDFNFFGFSKPTTLGADYSGVVVAVGPDVNDIKVGLEVYGTGSLVLDGAFAEYALVSTDRVAAKPKSLTHVQAASVPVALLSAWEAMVDLAPVGPNDTVYVPGGAGGVASFAVALAKAAGAKVVTSGSRQNTIDFCRNVLKADGVFNYKEKKTTEAIQELNNGKLASYVYDSTYSPDSFVTTSEAVAANGTWSVLGSTPPAESKVHAILAEKKAKLVAADLAKYSLGAAAQAGAFFVPALNKAAAMFDSGKLQTYVTKTVQLDGVQAALDDMKAGKEGIGKLVCVIKAPKTMKAVQFVAAHQPLVVAQVPIPTFGDDQILVEVHAAGLNPVDYKLRDYNFLNYQKAVTLGFDFSGVVVGVGKNVTDYKGGEEIYGTCALNKDGAFAEYLATSPNMTAIKPANISHAEAAVGVTLLSAWEPIVDLLKVGPNDSVYVPGGAGGVGNFAVLVAKALGAKVFTSASREASIKFCESELKADGVFNYKTEDTVTAIKRLNNGQLVTAVYDATYSEAGYKSTAEALAVGGRWCALQDQLPAAGAFRDILAEKKAELTVASLGKYTFYPPQGQRHFAKTALAKANEWFANGKLKTFVTKTVTLDEVQATLEVMKKGDVVGKVVAIVKQ